MRTERIALIALGLCAGVSVYGAEPVELDNFEAIDQWQVIASEGVSARASSAPGRSGQGLRFDFDFERGAGFCVLHRALSLDLPPHYRFSFALRGEAPANNLEFKLLDPSGQNVWWVNRRAFEFPVDWQTLTSRSRQFRFAWGPSGGAPLSAVGAIEIAVAAATGGKGYLVIDQLQFEALPAPSGTAELPTIQYSSTSGASPSTSAAVPESGRLTWTSSTDDPQPWFQVTFPEARELGGLALVWDADDYATAYTVAVSPDGQGWEPAVELTGGNGGCDYVLLPVVEIRAVRLDVRASSRGRGVGVRELRFLTPELAETPNRLFAAIAADAPRGRYPRYLLDEQQSWTVVGVPHDSKEALLDVDGALEVDERLFRIEPFLFSNARLVTWADVTTTPALADDYLPIPSVTWRGNDLQLVITALADGAAGQSTLLARYVVENTSLQPQRGSLFLAVRPFQVLPPWQDLNLTGGLARLERITWSDGRVLVNGGQKLIHPWSPPDGFGGANFTQGEIVEDLAHGELPSAQSVQDSHGWASAALRYDFDLAAGEQLAVVLEIPFHDSVPHGAAYGAADDLGRCFLRRLERVRRMWTRDLNRLELSLPPAAERLVRTFRSTLAHILINSDGPALQPGSRTYQRSWIRDGAMECTALLYAGHAESARAFLDWFAPYQFASGKIPCVVDRRGPDPVPEHDSTGQYIYAVWQYYRFTRDRAFLERHLAHVVAGVEYLEGLRAARLTPEYRDGPPEKRACYGLLPESISHEGYSAQPMHSYWDDFWTMRGLEDAVRIAEALDRADLAARFAALRDAFHTSLYESLPRAMANAGIDYLPGCAELGDFDATSTAIAIYPCGQADALPAQARVRTFERYYDFFTARRSGARSWENYTPYEIRLVSTFVRLGQPERAHELLDYFFQDQSPPAWNQWAEVVWCARTAPKFIGDMPHTWVGADYLHAARTLFVYERERDAALVLGAGLRPAWLTPTNPVVVENWPTPWGDLSYALETDESAYHLSLEGRGEVPPGGLVFCIPGTRAILQVIVDGEIVPTPTGRELLLKTTAARVTIRLDTSDNPRP